MTKILVIDDEPTIVNLVQAYLKPEGYEVFTATDGPSGLKAARAFKPDLVVLDVMLPGMDGFQVARELREQGVDSAVLFLTARGELGDRVQGLDLGGDAYLVKPFAMPELLATLRALSRRERGAGAPRVTFAAGRGALDTVARTVAWDGAEVAVTGREYALLEALALSPERWFTREDLIDRVWGPEFGGEARIVDVYVRYVRRKMAPEAISSERGRGYRVER